MAVGVDVVAVVAVRDLGIARTAAEDSSYDTTLDGFAEEPRATSFEQLSMVAGPGESPTTPPRYISSSVELLRHTVP